ncbi:DUF2179 domain-containing protein [Mucisphaera sp.]|uniref:DUF2179 domain-containing protein n=1 Tax=Mucisphaera sp. TaxID=2913024 RepID=UPI003D0D2B81
METAADFAWYLPLLIFLARVADVSLGTIRMILVIAGRRWISAFIGFIEVAIWALAVGGLVTNLSNPIILVFYAGGFAAGTILGIYIEEWIALGIRLVRVINRDTSINLCRALREKGFRVTRVEGTGQDGPVEIGFSIVRRTDLPAYQDAVHSIAPKAWIAVERAEQASATAITSDANKRRRKLFGLGAIRK